MASNKVAKSEVRDRLSELPDSLILGILSLLPMKDVVITTFLSKHWKNLWTTVPCLDFLFLSYTYDKTRSFIYGALSRWKGPKILKFCISLSYSYFHANDLDSWLHFAIEKQVAELSILLSSGHRDGPSDYCPPQRLYSCSSITKLYLSFCNMKIEENVQWRIWAPNLSTLEIWGWFCGSCFLYVPSLTNAVLHIQVFGIEKRSANCLRDKMVRHVFQSIRHVENVTLSNWCIEFLLYMKNDDMVVHFSNAKFLTLFTFGEIDEMLTVLEMFPNLTILSAKLYHPKSGVLMSKTTASLLHLKTIEITWSLRFPSIFPLIEILLGNAHMLEKMVLRLINCLGDPETFILALEKVLTEYAETDKFYLVRQILLCC